MFDNELPLYDGERKYYLVYDIKKDKLCEISDSSFELAMLLLMVNGQFIPSEENLKELKQGEICIDNMKPGDRIENPEYGVECRYIDCDEYANLDLEIVENGF